MIERAAHILIIIATVLCIVFMAADFMGVHPTFMPGDSYVEAK